MILIIIILIIIIKIIIIVIIFKPIIIILFSKCHLAFSCPSAWVSYITSMDTSTSCPIKSNTINVLYSTI